jgi:hypothetical protein
MPAVFLKIDLLVRRILAGMVLLGVVVGCTPAGGRGPGTETPSTAPWFKDTAGESGIRYEWRIPGSRPLNILQTIGNGCAFLDYDRDGNLDVLS